MRTIKSIRLPPEGEGTGQIRVTLPSAFVQAWRDRGVRYISLEGASGKDAPEGYAAGFFLIEPAVEVPADMDFPTLVTSEELA